MDTNESPNMREGLTLGSRRSLASFLVIAVLGLILICIALFALPRILAEITYPLDYEDIILAEAESHDLDPFLVAAVIFAESRFKPNATSPVGARGLMQLMPATALGISNRMDDNTFTLTKLYDPATNIKYGTFHLQGLMGRYNSDIEAALAAYNGGGGVGDRYLAGERTTIPLETQRYVIKVTGAYKKYQELYPTRFATSLDAIIGTTTQPRETFVSRILNFIRVGVSERLTQ